MNSGAALTKLKRWCEYEQLIDWSQWSDGEWNWSGVNKSTWLNCLKLYNNTWRVYSRLLCLLSGGPKTMVALRGQNATTCKKTKTYITQRFSKSSNIWFNMTFHKIHFIKHTKTNFAKRNEKHKTFHNRWHFTKDVYRTEKDFIEHISNISEHVTFWETKNIRNI